MLHDPEIRINLYFCSIFVLRRMQPTTNNFFHISDHSRNTCVHSATTGSSFVKSFTCIYVFGNMPTARDFRGQVPRNHFGHSSNISTESPTSKGRPNLTSPCQLCIAGKLLINIKLIYQYNNKMQRKNDQCTKSTRRRREARQTFSYNTLLLAFLK